jgi:hypothetical protein
MDGSLLKTIPLVLDGIEVHSMPSPGVFLHISGGRISLIDGSRALAQKE